MYEYNIPNLLFYLWEVAVSFSCENWLFLSNVSDSWLTSNFIDLILKGDQMRVNKIDLQRQHGNLRQLNDALI